MINNRFLSPTAGKTSRSGFTLVELLVVIGIIAILAGVALGPITHGLENAKESAGLQTARTIALADFQYANDNGYTYAAGTDSEDVAIALIQGQYITDPSIFAATRGVAYTGSTQNMTAASFTPAMVCWDFIVVPPSGAATANTGLTTSDPDGMPVVFTTGQTVAVPQQGPGPAIVLGSGTNKNPFGTNGMAVCFKSNSAQFLKAVLSGTSAQVNTSANNQLFNGSFTTAASATYKQITP